MAVDVVVNVDVLDLDLDLVVDVVRRRCCCDCLNLIASQCSLCTLTMIGPLIGARVSESFGVSDKQCQWQCGLPSDNWRSLSSSPPQNTLAHWNAVQTRQTVHIIVSPLRL